MPPGPAAPPPPPHPSPGAEPTPLGQQRLPGPCPPSARPHPVTRRQRGRTPLEAPPSPSPLHPVPNPAGSGTPLAPLLCTGVSQRSKDEEAAIKLGGKQVWLDSGLGARDTDLGTATAPAPCPRRFYFRMEVPEKAKTAARKRLPGGGFCPGWRQQPGPWPCWVGAVLPPESTALRGDTTGQPPTVQPHHPRLHGDPIPASPLRQPGVQNWEPL